MPLTCKIGGETRYGSLSFSLEQSAMTSVPVPGRSDVSVTVRSGAISTPSSLTFTVERDLPCAIVLGFDWFSQSVHLPGCGACIVLNYLVSNSPICVDSISDLLGISALVDVYHIVCGVRSSSFLPNRDGASVIAFMLGMVLYREQRAMITAGSMLIFWSISLPVFARRGRGLCLACSCGYAGLPISICHVLCSFVSCCSSGTFEGFRCVRGLFRHSAVQNHCETADEETRARLKYVRYMGYSASLPRIFCARSMLDSSALRRMNCSGYMKRMILCWRVKSL